MCHALSDAEVAHRKEQVRELMAQDRQKLLMRFPFTGSVAMRLELVPVHDCRLKTCSTDYESVYADIGFYSALNDEERLHVLAHEIWHGVLLHALRRQGRDPEKFNYAADMEIYFLLRKEGLGIPFHLPHMMDWEDKSAEEIYEALAMLDEEIAKNGNYVRGGESENIKAQGDGQGFDKHPEKDEQGDMHGDSGEEPYFDRDYRPGWRVAAAEAMREKAVAAAQQVERTRGTLPGHLQAVVNTLLKPEIRWQEVLAQFVTSCYGGSRRWLPPNRRHVAQGLYLQSQRAEALRAVVAIDTSGSTAGDLPKFFAELGSLLKTFGRYELTVVQTDAEVSSVETFDDARPCDETRRWEAHGCGGTDFRPVFDYVARHGELDPACLVYVTDGYGPAPEKAPPYPVLWVLTRDGVPPASWGRCVRLKQ